MKTWRHISTFFSCAGLEEVGEGSDGQTHIGKTGEALAESAKEPAKELATEPAAQQAGEDASGAGAGFAASPSDERAKSAEAAGDSREESKESAPLAAMKKDEGLATGGLRDADASESEAFGLEVPMMEEEATGTTSATGTAAVLSTRGTPATSGLKAGFADDNKQFNYFVQFLDQYKDEVDHLDLDIQERIILNVHDREGKSLPNTKVTVFHGNRTLCTGTTYADGSFYFFPSEYSASIREYRVQLDYQQTVQEVSIDRYSKRKIEIPFDLSRAEMLAVPLDIVFILDTTGSMGEEIQRLKATIELINLNLSSLSSKPRVRFGLVLYKDVGDEYVTRVVALTGTLEQFQRALNEVEASGGGDTPEDLQAALEAAMTGISWNRQGIRLSFIITDAPPHLDYGQGYHYVRAARIAREEGIKIYSVGTGGLNLMGEYILRQISQYTAAKYIFLTYGERGESVGGSPGSVSHHTGANYQTDKLEAIIIRFAKEELQHLSDQPIDVADEYFEATKIGTEEKEETLHKLFTMAVQQLIDYSSFRIADGTPTAVLPLQPAGIDIASTGEYFTEQIIFTLSREEAFQKIFRMVERKDLQSVLEELELQLSGLVDDDQASRVGKLLGADLLVSGKLYRKESNYEIFIKLLRVETGEILSITKALVDRRLGL